MSIITDSYKQAYALKNKAQRRLLKAKNDRLEEQTRTVRKAGEEQLRSAYSAFVRAASQKAQQNRDEGRFGGTAQNAERGAVHQHREARAGTLAQMIADVNEIELKMAENTAATQKKLDENQAALELKLAAQQVKEQKSAASAAAKTQKSAASQYNTTKAKVISMIKMGIYDSSFADILGVEDSEVRQAAATYKNKIKNSKSSSSKTSSKEDSTQSTKIEGADETDLFGISPSPKR